jgi:hypothetical protein
MDRAVVPPAYDPSRRTIIVKWPGVVLMQRADLEAEGVKAGDLDPIIGLAVLSATGVRYPEILSLTTWKRMDWVRLVVAIIVPTPIFVAFLALAIKAPAAFPVFLAISAFFGACAAWLVYTGAIVQKNMVRVAGTTRTITIRFDRPIWRRRRFHDELFYRAGISAGPLP